MTLEALNKRIKATTELREIVSTMKLLSSVSIGPYEKALASLKEYTQNVQDAFAGFMLNDGFLNIQTPKAGNDRVLAVLIGTDNGLVGKFNRDVLSAAQTYFRQNNVPTASVSYLCVGKRLGIITKNAVSSALYGTYAISNSLKEIAEIASVLLIKINDILSQKAISRVVVFHNYKETGVAQTPKMAQLMPLPLQEMKKLKHKKWTGRSLPMIPDDKAALLSGLIHEYLTVVLAGSLTASLAAEHYARMINMQQAEKNIDKALEDMNQAYQQARQTEITDELIDIVSGAEAIKSNKKMIIKSIRS